MSKFNVSCDLIVPVLLEIEADDDGQAEEKLFAMNERELLKLANTEEVIIDERSVDISEP